MSTGPGTPPDAAAAAPAVDRYVIDAPRSRFTVRAAAAGLLSAFGHNPTIAIREFSGEARFSAAAPAQTSLTLRAATASLVVQDDISDKDRREIERVMREEVLQVAKFPEVVFTSTGAAVTQIGDSRFRVDLTGTLALHGVTRPLRIAAQIFPSGDMLRAQGEFPLRQTDYDITLVSVAGGTLKLKDELNFSFDIVARKAA
jgi:polyisoprenoid-binding protein YceI